MHGEDLLLTSTIEASSMHPCSRPSLSLRNTFACSLVNSYSSYNKKNQNTSTRKYFQNIKVSFVKMIDKEILDGDAKLMHSQW